MPEPLIDSVFEELRRDENSKATFGLGYRSQSSGSIGQSIPRKGCFSSTKSHAGLALQRLIKQAELADIMPILVSCAKGEDERLASTALKHWSIWKR